MRGEGGAGAGLELEGGALRGRPAVADDLRTPARTRAGGNLAGRDAAGGLAAAVFDVATRLAAEGRSVFNLGGAEPASEGLYRFKVGFGTTAQELEAASYQVGGVVRRGMLWLANSARAVLSRS